VGGGVGGGLFGGKSQKQPNFFFFCKTTTKPQNQTKNKKPQKKPKKKKPIFLGFFGGVLGPNLFLKGFVWAWGGGGGGGWGRFWENKKLFAFLRGGGWGGGWLVGGFFFGWFFFFFRTKKFVGGGGGWFWFGGGGGFFLFFSFPGWGAPPPPPQKIRQTKCPTLSSESFSLDSRIRLYPPNFIFFFSLSPNSLLSFFFRFRFFGTCQRPLRFRSAFYKNFQPINSPACLTSLTPFFLPRYPPDPTFQRISLS